MKSRQKKHQTLHRVRPVASSKRAFFLILAILAALIYLAQHEYFPTQSDRVLGTTRYLAKGGDSASSGSGGEESSGGEGSGGGQSRSGSGSSSSGSGSDSSEPSRGDDSQSGSSQSNGGSEPTTRSETRSDTGIRTQVETKPDDARTEVRFSETERIRTRVKNGETRVDITSGGVKVRLEQRDDRMIIKAEREDGTQEELVDDTIFKIDERLGEDRIKIATAGGDQFVIQRGTAGAVTEFPLSVDLATNTLLVNTPAGQKAVTILPDQAVQNMLAANVVSRIGAGSVVEQIRTGALSSIANLIRLGERSGIPVYEINGVSDQRLLGFIPVSIPKTVTVSAETGAVVSTQVPPILQLLDLLSF